MLRRLRSASLVRLALCLAGFLAIGASFGLHPEPGGHIGPSPSGVAFAKLRILETRHACVACLTHGAALAAPLLATLIAVAPSEPASLPVDSSSHGRLAGMDLPGRSPPPERS